jgi:hypothetical protein
VGLLAQLPDEDFDALLEFLAALLVDELEREAARERDEAMPAAPPDPE